MWNYEKRLQYPINITQPNAKIAQYIMSQFVTVSQSLFIAGMCVKVQSHIIDCETDLIDTV